MTTKKPPADATPPEDAPPLIHMVRAQGREAGYPPRCLVHPNELAHMKAHDWIIAPDADRPAKE